MTYVRVKEETTDRLVLSREPSTRAWALFFAVVAIGLGAASYSVDYFIWKLAYLAGATFVAISCMEDWEECVLDKPAGKVTVRKQTLIQKAFNTKEGQKVVAAELEELMSVKVHKEDVKYGTVGHLVVMKFSSGFSIGVTETATADDKSEHELVAEKIHKFLQLDLKHAQVGTPISDFGGGGFTDENSSGHSSEDSFEQIDKAELVDEEAPHDEGQGEVKKGGSEGQEVKQGEGQDEGEPAGEEGDAQGRPVTPESPAKTEGTPEN